MKNNFMSSTIEKLIKTATSLGAFKANIIDVEDISFDASFRKMCASNYCGNYGKSYQCPPYVGEIDDLIQKVQVFQHVLVYQTISQLEDSYDFEGMMEAGKIHNILTQKLHRYVKENMVNLNFLVLGAGGCRLCKTCAILENAPCRNPEWAVGSLEAYGINVSKLAESAGMNYITGKDTVTYFGAIIF